MAPDGSKRLQNEGNTKTRSYAAKRWCFTWNNYPEDWWLQIVGALEKGDKYVMGEEVGEQGTPHIQGFIKFERKCRPKNKFGKDKVHWEKANGTDDENYIYCTKGTNVKQNMRIIVKDPLEGKVLYDWQKEVLDIIEKGPDDRTIHWFWEENGNTGKTSLVKHLCLKKNAIVVGGKSADIKYAISERVNNGCDIELVLLNITRTVEDYISYEAIEAVKDGIFFSGKYESNMCVFNCPIIICFANFEPERQAVSADRWNICKVKVS